MSRPNFERRHYNEIADALHREVVHIDSLPADQDVKTATTTLEHITNELVYVFRSDNGRFDIDRFLNAVWKGRK